MAQGLELYAVRNKEGQWFRRKGYGGYGKTWVDDFKLARIYAKPGPARGVVTFFATHYPDYGVPDIVVLKITSVEILDETERVAKAKAKRQKEIETREIRQREWELKRASEELEKAKERFARAKG
jgi:hypothetical protein